MWMYIHHTLELPMFSPVGCVPLICNVVRNAPRQILDGLYTSTHGSGLAAMPLSPAASAIYIECNAVRFKFDNLFTPENTPPGAEVELSAL